MAYTQAQIDTMKRAIASGVLIVRHGDEQITYRSLAEMRRALADMEAEVNPSLQTPRRTVAGFSRGL
jgi:hypothetical protein